MTPTHSDDYEDWWEQDLEPYPDVPVMTPAEAMASFGQSVQLAGQLIVEAYVPALKALAAAFDIKPPPPTGPRIDPFRKRGL